MKRCRAYKCEDRGDPFCPPHAARLAEGLCTFPDCDRPIANQTRALCNAHTIWVTRHARAYYVGTSVSPRVRINVVSTDWLDEAACASLDPELFFSHNYSDAAVETCEGCPVRGACLRYAIETNQEFGLWGGLSAQQRRTMGRRYRKTGELVPA